MDDMKPAVTKAGLLDMQVCVPVEWTNAQIKDFADSSNPCGAAGGWQIRLEGNVLLAGAHSRVPCHGRKGFVHVMLDA
jgi:hypothetical protein